MSEIINLHDNLNMRRNRAVSSPDIPSLPPKEEIDSGSARWMHWRLVKLIVDFEEELGSGQEVGILHPGSERSAAIRIDNIAYWNPDMLVILGADAEGSPVHHVHHCSSVDYSLVALESPGGKTKRVAEALLAGIVDT